MGTKFKRAWKVLLGRSESEHDELYRAAQLRLELEAGLRIIQDASNEMRKYIPLMMSHGDYMNYAASEARIGTFVSLNFDPEIKTGQHAGFKNTGDLVIHYLADWLRMKGRTVVAAKEGD